MKAITRPRPVRASLPPWAISNSSEKSKVPVRLHSITMPIRKPTSPALVTQNAFTAARAASGRWYQ